MIFMRHEITLRLTPAMMRRLTALVEDGTYMSVPDAIRYAVWLMLMNEEKEKDAGADSMEFDPSYWSDFGRYRGVYNHRKTEPENDMPEWKRNGFRSFFDYLDSL